MTLTVGIVGFGFAARTIHAPLIRAAGMRVTAIVTSRPEQVGTSMPGVGLFATLGQMLDGEDVDLVVIATPNHLHVEQAVACVLAGRHVVIDKPAAVDRAQLDELAALARRCDRQVAVFHNRRWDSDFLTLERLLNARRLGDINAFTMRWDRFRPHVPTRWREDSGSGGGVLLDLGSHMLDQTLRLFGRPHWVQASLIAQRDGATVEDAFEILMAKGSLLINLGVSSLAAAAAPRYRVHGSCGSFLKDGLDVQERQLRDACDPLAVDFGCEPRSQFGTVVSANAEPLETVEAERGCWLEFYRLMRDCVETGAPIPVSLAEAREVMEILDAARRSSDEGRRVDLP